jgi:hypothetical protein
MTSMRWSVPPWQESGLSECHPGRLPVFLADGRLRVVLEAYQRSSTPLIILILRNRLRLPKVRAFVDFLQRHWMHPSPSLE